MDQNTKRVCAFKNDCKMRPVWFGKRLQYSYHLHNEVASFILNFSHLFENQNLFDQKSPQKTSGTFV